MKLTFPTVEVGELEQKDDLVVGDPFQALCRPGSSAREFLEESMVSMTWVTSY
jgi:hypothetical protein